MSVLITAFDPFDGELNSSEELLRLLQSKTPREFSKCASEISYQVLPCAEEELQRTSLGQRIAHLFRERQVQHCILLGQAAKRNKIALERVALNLCNHDARECTFRAEILVRGAPEAYFTTFPKLESFYESLGEQRRKVEISNHAGIYLCNEVYFESLHYARQRQERMSILFVHLPLTEEQSKRRGGGIPFMPLEECAEIVSRILLWSQQELKS